MIPLLTPKRAVLILNHSVSIHFVNLPKSIMEGPQFAQNMFKKSASNNQLICLLEQFFFTTISSGGFTKLRGYPLRGQTVKWIGAQFCVCMFLNSRDKS